MSKEQIKKWAEQLGVSQAWVRRDLQRDRDLQRASRDPGNWTVLRYPDGELHAFPNSFFAGS
jgi:hypothetical protein